MTIALPVQSKLKAAFPVRNLKFAFDASPRYWFDANPFYSHMLNGMSAIFPQGELYLIEILRKVRTRIDNPQLQADISAFIGQEAMHSKEHTAFNRYADQHGIDIGTLEFYMVQLYTLMKKGLPDMQHMAIGCAIEHCTATLGAQLLRSAAWNERMRGPLRELWLWHAIEENEHKAVYFDAYIAAGGGYLNRVVWMVIAGSGLVGLAAHHCLRLLYADQQLSALLNIKALARIFHPQTGLFNLRVLGEFIDYYRPSFHPNDHDTKALESMWRERMQLKTA